MKLSVSPSQEIMTKAAADIRESKQTLKMSNKKQNIYLNISVDDPANFPVRSSSVSFIYKGKTRLYTSN